MAREPWLASLKRSIPNPVKEIMRKVFGLLTLAWSERGSQMVARRRASKPKTYNDKIRYKMAFDRRPILTLLADKVAARDFVAERVGSEVLLDVFCHADNGHGLQWESLPEQFVVKVNHGCGGLIIVSHAAASEVRLPNPQLRPGWCSILVRPEYAHTEVMADLCDYWLSLTYGWNRWAYREWAYREIKPQALIQEYAGGETGYAENLRVHCFKGAPLTYLVDFRDVSGAYVNKGRFLAGEFSACAEMAGLTRDQMIRVHDMSIALTGGLDSVRLDWMLTPEGPKFGEFTHYPLGGTGPPPSGHAFLAPEAIERMYFDAWQLPERALLACGAR